jgi:hypothetical protein
LGHGFIFASIIVQLFDNSKIIILILWGIHITETHLRMLTGEGITAVGKDHHRHLDSHSDPQAIYTICKERIPWVVV